MPWEYKRALSPDHSVFISSLQAVYAQRHFAWAYECANTTARANLVDGLQK